MIYKPVKVSKQWCVASINKRGNKVEKYFDSEVSAQDYYKYLVENNNDTRTVQHHRSPTLHEPHGSTPAKSI